MTTLEAAQQYVSAGLSVLPVLADGTKSPALPAWKKLQRELPTAADLTHWFGSGSPYGIGIIGGQVSQSLEILDFDDRLVYQEFLARAEACGLGALVDRLRAGCEQASPQGVHLPYYCPVVAGNTKLAKRPGADGPTPIKTVIETRGEGGYVVAAPSGGAVHLTGKPYVLRQGSWSTVTPITPEERADLWDLCRTFDRMPPRPDDHTTARHAALTTGTRPGDLFAAATSWADLLTPAGWTWVYRHGDVDYWRRPGKSVGISATTNYAGSDLLYVFSSSTRFDAERGYGKFSAFAILHHHGDFHAASVALVKEGSGHNGTASPQPREENLEQGDLLPDDPHIRFTDAGNGKRFARRYGHRMRYCTTWKSFLIWDGKRWARDQDEQAARWARETIFGIYEEGQQHATRATQLDLGIEDRKKYAEQAGGLLKHAVKSESGPRFREMLNFAKMDITILPDRLDADPWMLNCHNGTLDLRTGALHPHTQDEYLTKIVSVDYDPSARCPRWEEFLERIMDGRQDLIDYLQRAVGYSLTGDTREQCLFLAYGVGANGKSTYLNNLRDLCGDYAQQAAFNSFMHTERETVRNDLAGLRGARYVAAVEGGEGRRLAESLVKLVTGEDTLTVRFLFQEYFSFLPEFKLWLGTNHKPVIKGTDGAIWRRIQMIPFTVVIPEAERDGELNKKLRAEWPGILAWAVRGCLAWQQDGLQVPDIVRAATAEYRAEMDVFTGWLTECCIPQPQATAKSSDLFASYQQWTNDKTLTRTAFGLRLREQGFTKDKTALSVIWRGVGLLAPVDTDEQNDSRY